MSIKWMTWVWASSPYAGQRLLLHLALADFANDEGVCFPSHHTLARKARCSTSWVSQTMKQMVDDNMIEVLERAGNGRGKVGRYRLTKGVSESHLHDAIGVTATTDRSHSTGDDTLLMNRHEPSHAFDALWDAYPKKVAKGAARRAFDRMMRRSDAPTIDLLLRAVERYASTVRDMQYCAHLATWINAERWLDEQHQSSNVVVVDQSCESARRLGAGMANAGRTRDELLTSTSHLSSVERDAAVEQYEQTIQSRRHEAGE
jgi:DNA-binding IscR family transcriptional regulator